LLILYLTHCRDTGVYFLGHVHEPLRLLVLLPILPLDSLLLIVVVTASVRGFIMMIMLLLFMKATFRQLLSRCLDSSLGSWLLLVGLRIEGWGCGDLVFGGVREREVTVETRLGELGLDKWETYELRLLRRY
jgi:hypothetical protein